MSGVAVVRVKSHRAREKLKDLLGFLPDGYFSWERDGEWREVPVDRLEEILRIKGISRSKRADDLRPYLKMG